MKRPLRILLALVVIGVFCVFALILLSSRSAGLPNPNGYDDFVKAGELLVLNLDRHRDLSDYREMSLEQLRAFASTNAEALKAVRAGLQHQSRVPIQYNADWFHDHLGEMATFKKLTWLFLLAGRLDELEGRTNDAVNAYCDLIRFAHESARGGFRIEALITMAMESMAMKPLKDLRDSLDADSLDAEQSRRIVKMLEELTARRESWSEINRRDLRYTFRAETKALFSPDTWTAMRNSKASFYAAEHRRVLDMLDFAARAYELKTGSRPTNIVSLVPDYLSAIPRDPLTGTNLVYPLRLPRTQ